MNQLMMMMGMERGQYNNYYYKDVVPYQQLANKMLLRSTCKEQPASCKKRPAVHPPDSMMEGKQ